MKFHNNGDSQALDRAINIVISKIKDVCYLELPPISSKYFIALGELVDGIIEALSVHGKGDAEGALLLIWRSLQACTDEIVPKDSHYQETYSLVMESIDGIVSEMSRHMLEYKRAIHTSRVCYKRSVQRERVRPRQCKEGFQWDQGHLCWPSRKNGADCYKA